MAAAICAAGLSVLTAGSALGSCAGPSFSYEPVQVDRGGTITVRGTAWGSNCYDTGRPPAGQGVLGAPAKGIEVLTIQGDDTFVVATVTAGNDYKFTVKAVVPTEIKPGAARVAARKDGVSYPLGPAGNVGALQITDRDPVQTVQRGDSDKTDDPQAERDQSSWLVVGLAIAAFVVIVAGTVWIVRRKRAPTPTV